MATQFGVVIYFPEST